MFSNFTNKLKFSSYAGNNFNTLTGFEQVTSNGVTVYYLIEWGTSRAIKYNDNWVYQTYYSFPYSGTYVRGYLYF